MSDWYKEVLRCVAEDNVALAINKVKEVISQFSFIKYEIEITALENQFTEIKKKDRLNISDERLAKNRIIYNLLVTAEEIKQQKNEKIGEVSEDELDKLLRGEIDDLENLNETLTKDNYSLSDVIGRNLKYLLKRGKFSLKDVIKLTHSSSSSILGYLKGVEIPPMNFLLVLAKLYDLDVTYFFFPRYKGKSSFLDNDLLKWAIVDSMTEKRYYEFINDLDYFYYQIAFEWAKGMQEIYEYLYVYESLPRNKEYLASKVTDDKLNYLRNKFTWLEIIVCREFGMDISEKAEYILSRMFSTQVENLLIMYKNCYVTINLEINLKSPFVEFGWWDYIDNTRKELKEFNTVEYEYD